MQVANGVLKSLLACERSMGFQITEEGSNTAICNASSISQSSET
jgi:hypothetical protein